MKLKNVFVKTLSLACIGAAVLVSSCMDEERLTLQDTQDITEEAITDSYFQDLDDMAGVAVDAPEEIDFNGGRVSSTITIEVDDDRFQCTGNPIQVTVEATGNADAPSGVITVDFGEGCTDTKGNIRTGKLIFTYTGKRFQLNSKVITTTNNYTINGIKLEGTRTLTNVTGTSETSPKFNVTLVNGKATFVDGDFALRQSDFTWQWIRGTTVANDYLKIDKSSTASGTTRGERIYEVSLTKDLIFKRSCGGIPVEGIKKYLINGDKEIVIDYGEAKDCDRKIVITVNGITRSLTVN